MSYCLHDDNKQQGDNIMRPVDRIVSRLENELSEIITSNLQGEEKKQKMRIIVERLNKAYILLDKCNNR